MSATVLIVDDELGSRESLRMILKPHYTVLTAESAAEALAILEQTPIDLTTLELRMPGEGGMALLGKVRKTHPNLPVLIITGYGSRETEIEGLKQGVVDHLSKLVDVHTLLNAVRKGIKGLV